MADTQITSEMAVQKFMELMRAMAPLKNPSFTGTPLAPTAAMDDTDTQQIVNVEYLRRVLDAFAYTNLNLSGMIGYFAGRGDIPEGWLLCNGAAVSRTKFASLFKAIGTTYGAGDGTTTFNIPNIESGRFIESTLDSTQVGVKHEEALPNIIGSLGAGKDQDPARQLMDINKSSGAFFYETKWMQWTSDADSGDDQLPSKINFDASRSSSIYYGGKYQQKSLLAIPIIHI